MKRKDILQLVLLYCLSGIMFVIGFLTDKYTLFYSYNEIISEGISIVAFIPLALLIAKIASLLKKYRRLYFILCGFAWVFSLGVGVKLIQFFVKMISAL